MKNLFTDKKYLKFFCIVFILIKKLLIYCNYVIISLSFKNKKPENHKLFKKVMKSKTKNVNNIERKKQIKHFKKSAIMRKIKYLSLDN